MPEPSSSGKPFRIDVCRFGSTESIYGYLQYATDEAHAHALAEQAARELELSNRPGEYFVAVSEGEAPVASQIIVVTPTQS